MERPNETNRLLEAASDLRRISNDLPLFGARALRKLAVDVETEALERMRLAKEQRRFELTGEP